MLEGIHYVEGAAAAALDPRVIHDDESQQLPHWLSYRPGAHVSSLTHICDKPSRILL
jgi:hypothetical protein